MVGHSKWSKDKHIQGLPEDNRGTASNKLAKKISVAARLGGGELSENPRRRSIVNHPTVAGLPGNHLECPNKNFDEFVKKSSAGIPTAARVMQLDYGQDVVMDRQQALASDECPKVSAA